VTATDLLRRCEAANELTVTKDTIRRWAAAGRLDERWLGPRTVRVTRASVERLRAEAFRPAGGAA
jgi:excisionase family DNA binding protein